MGGLCVKSAWAWASVGSCDRRDANMNTCGDEHSMCFMLHVFPCPHARAYHSAHPTRRRSERCPATSSKARSLSVRKTMRDRASVVQSDIRARRPRTGPAGVHGEDSMTNHHTGARSQCVRHAVRVSVPSPSALLAPHEQVELRYGIIPESSTLSGPITCSSPSSSSEVSAEPKRSTWG